ncbi:HAAS signaling domain-containing protein [Lysinibacillus sphaericus]|uniref:Uncharacterized protein n=1 Tax=Lysinibacillus sphaericus OT4b.31 TaxID=1285586 RepID=R7ZA97_LYSSH|nr:hypothetical protein [Lysinibacillus sphaericus]EON71075.1 hypothetical protein H131_18892 [Lysinibacillus sphaericus OT4b.31]
MNLIDVYIYEVTRRLPKKIRDDIRLELKSKIEDSLPDTYSELEVKDVLLKLGDPAELAASYQDISNHLIGPLVYDTYIRTIKLVIPWAIFITTLVQIIESIVFYTGEGALLSTIIKTISITIATIISVLFHVLFWVTIAFIVIERTGNFDNFKVHMPFLKDQQQWTPDDLKKVKIIANDKNIPLNDIVFSFLGIAIFSVVYFKANHLIGIYTSDERTGLKFVMPIFNQNTLLSYEPFILFCIVLSIGLTFYKWKVRQWTIPLAVINAFLQVVTTIVFILMARQPDLIHGPAIPYIAAIMETTASKVAFSIDRILLVIIAISIVANSIDIVNRFKKAKIKP